LRIEAADGIDDIITAGGLNVDEEADTLGREDLTHLSVSEAAEQGGEDKDGEE